MSENNGMISKSEVGGSVRIQRMLLLSFQAWLLLRYTALPA